MFNLQKQENGITDQCVESLVNVAHTRPIRSKNNREWSFQTLLYTRFSETCDSWYCEFGEFDIEQKFKDQLYIKEKHQKAHVWSAKTSTGVAESSDKCCQILRYWSH